MNQGSKTGTATCPEQARLARGNLDFNDILDPIQTAFPMEKPVQNFQRQILLDLDLLH